MSFSECKECKYRHIGCKSKCEKYKAYLQWLMSLRKPKDEK